MTRADAEFEALVAAQLPALLRIAHLMTGNPARAEDLLQNALVSAFLAKRRVCAADSPPAYLRQILLNAHRRSFRRLRVREVLTADPPERAAEGSPSDTRGDLVAAVGGLPRRQRAVVVLRYLEDLSEAEVAGILGCSVGTVKSQAARALAKLRAHPALSTELITEETSR